MAEQIQFSRRSALEVFIGAFAGLATSASFPAAASTETKSLSANPDDSWTKFQKLSELTGVYKGDGGAYVVLEPKNSDDQEIWQKNAEAWSKAAEGIKSLNVLDTDLYDFEGAVFWLPDGQDALISQNAIGAINNTNSDQFPDDSYRAKHFEGRTIISIIPERNIFARDDLGLSDYSETFDTSGHTFAFDAGTALVTRYYEDTIQPGDEKTFTRDRALEAKIQQQLKTVSLRLADIIPDSLAILHGAFLSDNRDLYLFTEGVSDSKLLLTILTPDNKQSAQYELSKANIYRNGVSEQHGGGADYHFVAKSGEKFSVYSPDGYEGGYKLAVFKPDSQLKHNISLPALENNSAMVLKALEVLTSNGKHVKIIDPNNDKAATVVILSGSPPAPKLPADYPAHMRREFSVPSHGG